MNASLRRLVTYIVHLPRHPFKLARALLREPLFTTPGPRNEHDVGRWTKDFPILIVDNRPRYATGLHAALRRANWRAIITRTGRGGLALCQHTRVSLVIVHHDLPDMTQTEFINALVKEITPATRDRIPIVALTTPRLIAQRRLRDESRPNASVLDERDTQRLLARVGTLLLEQGHWILPPRYSLERAAQTQQDHIFAR